MIKGNYFSPVFEKKKREREISQNQGWNITYRITRCEDYYKDSLGTIVRQKPHPLKRKEKFLEKI